MLGTEFTVQKLWIFPAKQFCRVQNKCAVSCNVLLGKLAVFCITWLEGLTWHVNPIVGQHNFTVLFRRHFKKYVILTEKTDEYWFETACDVSEIYLYHKFLPILLNFILFQTLKKSSILWWLPIDLQIEFKILIVTYSPWTGSCLQLYIKNLLHSYIPAQDLRSSKKNLLAVPAFNINSHGHHAFSVAAPLLWNSLPQHIRDAGSWDIFKRQLKTVLFRCALLILLMMWLWCFISYIIFFPCGF